MSNQITPNPSVPSQVVAEVKFPKFINNLGIIPTSYKDSMSYYECLAWLCKYLEETVIPTVNENGEAVEELQELYVELNNYVAHYFDTLDVQEEINNKLDDMTEAGTLEEIIGAYLSIKSLLAFDSINEMKNSTNLINGSYAKTLGFYSLGDGGGAIYKIRTITNQDVVNNMTIIALDDNNLIAELIISNQLYLKQLGAVNNQDVSTILQFAINLCKEKYDLIIDDYYILSYSINIDRPINIKGLPSAYLNAMCGFNCNSENEITYFNFNEGAVYCTFENLNFHNNKIGNCIKFSSRDESLANYRVWKNQFNKCKFYNFKTAVIFYAVGDVSNYDYSSEMLFFDCKFYNNLVHCEYNNVQSYNTNFISTDFECVPSDPGIAFLLNTYGGINVSGGSLVLHGSFSKLSSSESLTPINTFVGIINIDNCRFETFNETIFDYTLNSRYAQYQQHSLNITNTDFYTHEDGTLIDCNVRGVKAICNFTMTGSRTLTINGQNQQGGSEFSKIFINTPLPERIIVNQINGNYKPWIILNGVIKSSCVTNGYENGYLELNNKLYLGFDRTNLVGTINIHVPWQYRKFVININGAFVSNPGTITISDGDSFTYTFTKTAGYSDNTHDEVYLPYDANGKDYTITISGIWGNCYFE